MPTNLPAPTEGRLLARAAAGGAVKAVAQHVTLTYIIPLGLPLVTGYLAHLRGVPWDQVLLFGGIMFAAVAHGLVKFDDWFNRRRVKDKLVVGNVRVLRDEAGPGIALGIELHNTAGFPVEFEGVDIRTKINNRVPPSIPYQRSNHTLQPDGVGQFDDHIIDFGDPPKPGTLEGFVEMEIRYGRPGRLRHTLIIKKHVVIVFNDDGLYANSRAQDAG
jgi:hypothetical protein